MTLTNGDIRYRPAVDTAGRVRIWTEKQDDMGKWHIIHGPDFRHLDIKNHIAHLTQLIGEGP